MSRSPFRAAPRRSFAVTALALVLGAGCASHPPPAPGSPAEAPGPAGESTEAEKSVTPEEAPRGGAGAASTPAPAAAPAPRALSLPRSTEDRRTKDLGPARRAGDEADDLDALTRSFEGSLALSVPDCSTAWAMRDRICDLADRLCDLAGRSEEPELADRCTDGRARCVRATAHVKDACSR